MDERVGAPDLSRRRLAFNTAMGALGNLVTLALGLLVLGAARKGLGEAGLGVWALAMGLLALAPLADFGLGAALGMDIARKAACGDDDAMREGVNAYLVIALPLAALVVLVGMLAAPALVALLQVPQALHADAVQLFRLVFAQLGWQLAIGAIGGVLVGHQLLGLFRGWQIVWQIVRFGGAWLLLQRGAMVAAGTWMLAGAIGFGLSCLWLWHRHLAFRHRFGLPSRSAIAALWRLALTLQAQRIAGALVGQADKFVLAALLGAIAAGWYEIGARLSGLISYVPTILFSAAAPYLAALSGAGRNEDMTRFLLVSARLVQLAALPVAVLVAAHPEPWLRLWLGEVQAPHVLAVRVLAVMYLVLALVQPLAQTLLGAGMTAPVARASVAFIFSAPLLSLAMTKLWGFGGGCWAGALAAVLFLFVLVRESLAVLENSTRHWLRENARGLLAALLAFALLAPWQPQHPLAVLGKAACFALAQLALAFLLGFVRRQDVAMLAGIWRRG